MNSLMIQQWEHLSTRLYWGFLVTAGSVASRVYLLTFPKSLEVAVKRLAIQLSEEVLA